MALVGGGCLVLGRAESTRLTIAPRPVTVDQRNRIFRKVE